MLPVFSLDEKTLPNGANALEGRTCPCRRKLILERGIIHLGGRLSWIKALFAYLLLLKWHLFTSKL